MHRYPLPLSTPSDSSLPDAIYGAIVAQHCDCTRRGRHQVYFCDRPLYTSASATDSLASTVTSSLNHFNQLSGLPVSSPATDRPRVNLTKRSEKFE